MTIIFKDIVKSYNGELIFKNISGQINEGDKIGLIGINGVGKTTLVKILTGEEEYDSGIIGYSSQHIKIGYLKQHNEFDEAVTVHEKLNSFINTAVIGANNSSYSKKLKNSLLKLGFHEHDFNKKISELSGGEKTKLSICLVLAENPDILILDEPTNHLDVDTIKWLENFINSINKTMLIISHDRLFLDNVVNRIFEMNSDKIEEYKGNYTDYRFQKENNNKYITKEYEKQQREIKHLEQVICDRNDWFAKAHKSAGQDDFLRAKSKKHASAMRAKKRQLEKLKDNAVERPKEEIAAAFELINKNNTHDKKLPNYLIRVNRLKKKFRDKVIFNGTAFNIRKGDKIALVGKNGAGKTTLIKILLGIENADSGTVNVNSSMKIGYFSQELENLNFKNTILDELLQAGVSKNEARLMLACLLFKGNDVFKTIETLSMGEKCRVAFAKLLLSGIDFLVLDEPTNHMDIVSKENIEKVLKKYEGTILFVSHDRYFIKSFAGRVFEIENQAIKAYEGDYNYYLAKKEEDSKKQQAGTDYQKIKDEIMKLECEIACLSGRLNNEKLEQDEKSELEQSFLFTAKKLREYKSIINTK